MDEDDRSYAAFLAGDQGGFEELVLRYKNHMIYFIEKFGPGFADAEDLAQDVFVEVLLHRERYCLGKGFKTYLFTIAHNKAVDWVRKRKREILTEELPEEGDSATLEQHILKKEQKEQLKNAIRRLNPEEQRLLVLRELEQLSYKEIARICGLSLPQTKVKIHRMRKKLQELLGKEEWAYEK